jgi:hypothetical protein
MLWKGLNKQGYWPKDRRNISSASAVFLKGSTIPFNAFERPGQSSE